MTYQQDLFYISVKYHEHYLKNDQVIELTENCNENSQSTHTHCYQRGIAVVPTVTVSVYYAVQKNRKQKFSLIAVLLPLENKILTSCLSTIHASRLC